MPLPTMPLPTTQQEALLAQPSLNNAARVHRQTNVQAMPFPSTQSETPLAQPNPNDVDMADRRAAAEALLSLATKPQQEIFPVHPVDIARANRRTTAQAMPFSAMQQETMSAKPNLNEEGGANQRLQAPSPLGTMGQQADDQNVGSNWQGMAVRGASTRPLYRQQDDERNVNRSCGRGRGGDRGRGRGRGQGRGQGRGF